MVFPPARGAKDIQDVSLAPSISVASECVPFPIDNVIVVSPNESHEFGLAEYVDRQRIGVQAADFINGGAEVTGEAESQMLGWKASNAPIRTASTPRSLHK